VEEAPNECPSAAQASTPSGQPGDGGHTRGTTRTLCYQGPLRSPRPRVQCEGRRCSTTQLLLTRTFWFSTKDSHNRATFFSPVLLLTPLSPRALSSHIAKLHKPESLVETRRPPTHPPKPLRPFPALKLHSAMPHCTTLDCSVQTRASRRDPCSCLRGATALFPSPIFFCVITKEQLCVYWLPAPFLVGAAASQPLPRASPAITDVSALPQHLSAAKSLQRC